MVRCIFQYMIGHHNASNIYRVNAVYMAHKVLTQWEYQWASHWTKEMHSDWKIQAIAALEAHTFMAENPIYEECYGWLVR